MTRSRYAPLSADELADFVRDADQELRGVGSETSKSPCFKTDGVALSLEAFTSIERISDTRVRVGAGTILADLLSYLRSEKLALPTIGEWAGQTVGGVISTATHGGSYRYGSVCTSVQRVVLIDGTGTRQVYERDQPGFDHLMPSFGTTGVMIEFDLECEPIFNLSLGRRCLAIDDYLGDLMENPENVEFRSAVWLPATGHVIDYSASRIGNIPAGYRAEREVRFNNPIMVFDWLTRQSARLFAPPALTALTRLPLDPISATFPYAHCLGPYDEILAPLKGTAANILKKRKRNRTPPEGEFAVPIEHAAEVIDALSTLFVDVGSYPDRPVGLRPARAESGTLAAPQRDSVWISMFIYEDNPIMEVLPDFLNAHQARPHWGKCVFHNPDDIPGLYPNWTSFCQFRSMLDPSGVFVNGFAKQFGIRTRPHALRKQS